MDDGTREDQAASGEPVSYNYLDLEAENALDDKITVQVSRPMKLALTRLSAHIHLSVADLIRMAVRVYLPEVYPEYTQMYMRALTETKPKRHHKETRNRK